MIDPDQQKNAGQEEPIILASGSPRRREMLRSMNIDFQVIPSGIDEQRAKGESPVDFARRAAREKGAQVGRDLSRQGRRPFVVAADTVVVLGDEVLLKPRDKDEARSMLFKLAGRVHTVITGWTVGRAEGSWHVDHTETKVTFHPLSSEQIEGYLATGEGMDKAGAYAIQGIGAFLVDKIDGNYHNVVGLPISHVIRALLSSGALTGFPLS